MQPEIIPGPCEQLQELQRDRAFFIKETTRLANAGGALVRRAMGWRADMPEKDREGIAKRAAHMVADIKKGVLDDPVAAALADNVGAFLAAAEPPLKRRHQIELTMKHVVRRLPVAAWADGVKGFGELALAVIVGEAGDLSKYPNPGKLWKRLGLAPLSKDGETKAAGSWRREGGLSADDWTAAGYSPRRRAELFAVVGDPLFRAQWRSAEKHPSGEAGPIGPYGEVYLRRRQHTAATHPDWTPKHSQMDALRIMTKQLVLDLWVEWRRASGMLKPRASLPAANLSGDEPGRPTIVAVEPAVRLSDADFSEAA